MKNKDYELMIQIQNLSSNYIIMLDTFFYKNNI